MADYVYLDGGDKDGTLLGQYTTSLVAFYGIQPVDQPASLTARVSTITYTTATAFVSAVYVSSVSTVSAVGFVSTAEFGGVCKAVQNLQTRIGELEDRFQEIGLIAGGTAITTTTANKFDFVGYGNDDGDILGHYTSSKVGFWGVTPVDQPSAVTTMSAFTTMAVTATVSLTAIDATLSVAVTGAYGLGTAETNNMAHSFLGVIANLQTRMYEVETNLTEVGVLPGGTAIATTASAREVYSFLDKGSEDGSIFGPASTSKIGFWAGTPGVQVTALTTAQTTIVFVSAVAATFVITSMLIGTSTFKFISVTAGNTLVYAVQNAQKRLGDIEAAMESWGLQAG